VGSSASSQSIKANAGTVRASTGGEGVNVDGLGANAKAGRISVTSTGTIDPAITVKAGAVQLAPKATTRLRARHTARVALRSTTRIVRHTQSSVRSLLDIHGSGTVSL
jgi:hypothetical protein